MDDTEYMTEAEALKLINKKQDAARKSNRKEEQETGLDYKLLKSE